MAPLVINAEALQWYQAVSQRYPSHDRDEATAVPKPVPPSTESLLQHRISIAHTTDQMWTDPGPMSIDFHPILAQYQTKLFESGVQASCKVHRTSTAHRPIVHVHRKRGGWQPGSEPQILYRTTRQWRGAPSRQGRQPTYECRFLTIQP